MTLEENIKEELSTSFKFYTIIPVAHFDSSRSVPPHMYIVQCLFLSKYAPTAYKRLAQRFAVALWSSCVWHDLL